MHCADEHGSLSGRGPARNGRPRKNLHTKESVPGYAGLQKCKTQEADRETVHATETKR